MRSLPARFGALAAATLLVVALPACASNAGKSGSTGGGGNAANAKIAFLMPDLASTRYELQDAPLFKAKVKELCGGCTVLYQNADADASKQQQQANSAVAQGVKVIVIDPVDSAAAATIVQSAKQQSIPVISYDRPVPKMPPSFYVSFDNEKIGASIAQSLIDKLKQSNAQGGILIVNGSPTDAAAGLIKKGVHSAVDASGLTVLAEYDTPEWQPAKAQDWVSGQISKFGAGKIAGVVAANDGTGGGAIAAFKAAGVPVPPITGNDAEIAAIQRIIAGDQYNTISKPIKIVADAAAEAAMGFVQGKTPQPTATLFDAPSQLFTPTVVTAANVKSVIFDKGIYKSAEVCTGAYRSGCTKLGIQ